MIERVDQASTLQQAAQTAAVKSEQAIEKAVQKAETATEITLRYPTDQVEISEQGYAKLAQQARATPGTATTEQKAEDPALESAKRTMQQLESSGQITKATAEDSAAESTTNLTSLTEQQLEDLVKEGSITRSQADSELARRQESSVDSK